MNLPGPFWISTRIRGLGCFSILLWPLELSLWLLIVLVALYVELAKSLWPRGWWGKALTILTPVLLIIIGSVSGAASSSQHPASASPPTGQTQSPATALAQSPSPTPAPSHGTQHRATWAAFISRYSSDADSFHIRDARTYCSATHPADSGCVQRLRKHAEQLGIISVVVHPTPVTSTSSPSSGGGGGCYPKTDSGNCYEPGEFCRDSDHGVKGVAGDGEAIQCEDNNGWRWEPV